MKPTKDGWPEFTQQNPVKVKVLNHPSIQELNSDLERDPSPEVSASENSLRNSD